MIDMQSDSRTNTNKWRYKVEYKITQKVLDLVEKLFEEGYKGSVEITKGYATGTAKHLEGRLSVQLSGFCKEHLYIVERTGSGYCDALVFVGRYDCLGDYPTDCDVHTVVDIAWQKYKTYKDRGYGMPHEFESLFVKYGYLKKKVVEVYEEQD